MLHVMASTSGTWCTPVLTCGRLTLVHWARQQGFSHRQNFQGWPQKILMCGLQIWYDAQWRASEKLSCPFLASRQHFVATSSQCILGISLCAQRNCVTHQLSPGCWSNSGKCAKKKLCEWRDSSDVYLHLILHGILAQVLTLNVTRRALCTQELLIYNYFAFIWTSTP